MRAVVELLFPGRRKTLITAGATEEKQLLLLVRNVSSTSSSTTYSQSLVVVPKEEEYTQHTSIALQEFKYSGSSRVLVGSTRTSSSS